MTQYPKWITRAAEELHDALDDIDGEAGQCGQVEQSPEAERACWVDRVTNIIGKHWWANIERDRY